MERESITASVDALYEASDRQVHAILAKIVDLALNPPPETAL